MTRLPYSVLQDRTRLLDDDDELMEVGIDWSDVGRQAFGVLHTAGGTVLNVFGQKQLTQQLETMESKAGLLPDWAKGVGGAPAASGPSVTVAGPEFVVFVRPSNPKGDVLSSVASVVVTGGTRFAGNGYMPGEGIGKHFSFGIDAPSRIDLTLKTGDKGVVTDAARVLFLGGAETRVAGAEVCGFDGFPVEEQVGDWSPLDILATIATGGVYGVAKHIKDSRSARGSIATPGAPQDYTTLPAYQQAQARLAAAQARLAAAKGRTAPAVIPVTVPSFNLDSGSTPMSTDSSIVGYYLAGTDVVGAAPKGKPRPTPKPIQKPVGKPFKPVAIKRAAAQFVRQASPHVEALAKEKVAVQKALKAGSLAKARADQYKPAAHKTLIPMKAVVHGDEIVLGTDRHLTPAQTAAIQTHANALARTAQAVRRSKIAAARAIAAAKVADKAAKKYAPKVKKFIPSGHRPVNVTKMHGDEVLGDAILRDLIGDDLIRDILGDEFMRNLLGDDDAWTSIIGDSYWHDIVGAPTDPDPLNPGFLIDGSPDPNYTGAGGGTVDTTTTTYTPEDFIPPVRGQPLNADEAKSVWEHVPDNGVVYDPSTGAKGSPSDAFGSYNIMYGPAWINEQQGDGFIWHANPGEPSMWWAIRHGHGDRQPDITNLVASSTQFGWGPLVGNPNGDLAGLQYATVDNKWFWQSDKAPTWATTEIDQGLKDAWQKTQDALKAATDADAARIAQEQAEAQEAQAKQDAANALAQSAADTQAQIAQQQQAAQQAQLDLQQQKIDQQLAAQQAALDMKAQQAELDYAIAHPEVAMPDTGEAPSYDQEVPPDMQDQSAADEGFTPEELQPTADEEAAAEMDQE